MTGLGELLSELSSSIHGLKDSDQSRESEETHPPGPVPDIPDLDQIEQALNAFSNRIDNFCPGEIPDLGVMLNTLDELIDAIKAKDFILFHEICIACKGHGSSLIDLEQDPSNADIINDIFRPFHTIKGVSDFLSLTKINKLAHTTENLLDSARSRDFYINDTATDVILESVDTLKKLIAGVRQGTQTGFKEPDDDIDVDTVREKLQKLHAALTRGDKEPLGEILVKKGTISRESLPRGILRCGPIIKTGILL